MQKGISVIVPVYNTQEYVKQCIDSLINQTFKNLEILIINDCSPDNSIQLISEYKDERIKVVNLDKNVGLSAARNIGINMASCEYIGFVDSDDWIDKDYYEKLYNAAKKHDADITVSGIKHCRKFNFRTMYLKMKKEYIATDINEKIKVCKLPNMSFVWNKIYRLDYVKKYNLFFEEGMNFEDIVYAPMSLYYSNKVVSVPKVYYNYRLRSNSILKNRSEKNFRDYNKAKEMASEFCKSHNIDIDYSDAVIERVKFCGLTIFKKTTKKTFTTYKLFNLIQWEKHLQSS